MRRTIPVTLGSDGESDPPAIRGDDPQAIRDELEKLTSSSLFYRSERLCCFLRFIVDRWLQDPADAVKEYHIATEVYCRPPSFDSRIDPIVRVEARRLRMKLHEYYQTKGRGDPLRILLPVGSYAPVIRMRTTPAGVPASPLIPDLRYVGVETFTAVDSELIKIDFCRGLCDEIVHALDAEGVRVCASPVRCFDEISPGSPPVCGFLQGTIRMFAENLQVSAKLTDTTGREIIWSRIYSLQISDEFTAQESIATAIASDVRGVVVIPMGTPTMQKVALARVSR